MHMFIPTSFTIVKIWKQTKCPLIDKQRRCGTYGIITQPEASEILSFVTTWMDLESIMLSEISQTENAKCHMILLICGI